ncbi:MAG: 2-C-methyl-D-erythritol 4-phosphate cytidylyltransferase [Candidatus Acetothermia bacterium]
MFRNKTVGAVILAAGKSERMSGEVNKVYREVGGKPVLLHSIDAFGGSGFVDELVLVYNEEDEADLEEKVVSKLDRGLPLKAVTGGEKRQDSSLAGLNELTAEYAIVHDGARPNFSLDLLERLLKAASENRAAFPGIRPVDTIRKKKGGFAGPTLDRDELVRVQTPQCFERSLLLEALEESVKRRNYYTDDGGAVMDYWELNPKVVSGERENVKLTTEKDMRFAELLFSR